MTSPVTYLVVGAGDRGRTYASCAEAIPQQARVVAVAEPREEPRDFLAARHSIPADKVFPGWREAAAQPRLADAVIIATQDRMHAEPVAAFAAKGYHILLEKPMAVTPEDCRAITRNVRDNDVLLAVGHVLRYSPLYAAMKELVQEGTIGEPVSIQHLEPVLTWHQAHSFVRGNWSNQTDATFMLMAKSCHDLDLIRWLMGVPCLRVSSFGSLYHFRPENRPAGAGERCLQCEAEPDCLYSAPRFYQGCLDKGWTDWPLRVVSEDRTREGILKALAEGPYGRCVYAGHNDVVDHQVVNLNFEGGRSGVFTMTAFAHDQARRSTRLFGTRGELVTDGYTIDLHDFKTGQTKRINPAEGQTLSGHGGGDAGLFEAFTRAVAGRDAGAILSGPEETLESHLMVFAAEQARLEGRVVEIGEMRDES